MRILLCGNALHCNTGYGTQARYLAKVFQALGHEVIAFPHYGFKGGTAVIDGILHLPTHRDDWGHDVIGQHVKGYKIDAVVSFHDVWTLSTKWPREFAGVPWITYSPIDSIPVPPRLVEILREAKHVIAMSRFGEAQMHKAGITSTYIPHAIDTDIYNPGDKAEARRELGLHQDKFIALIVAANHYYPSRKAFPEQMAAFANFHYEFPETELFLHTAMNPTTSQGGLDLNALILNLGLGDCTVDTPDYDLGRGVPDREMALRYRAADVLLGASYAEGFGLCQAEAQACGTPIIVHDFAASPEYLFAGIKVPSAQRFWNQLHCWQAIPSIAAITKALRQVYLSQDLYAAAGRVAADRVERELSWEAVKELHWKPFLKTVEDSIHNRSMVFFPSMEEHEDRIDSGAQY